MDSQQMNRLKGTLYAVAAFAFWGGTPVYWKLLAQVPPVMLLAYRVVWTFVLTVGLVLLRRHWGILRAALANRRHRWAVVFCALTLSANWFIYLYAIATNHLIQASLGYYINPLLSVLFGVVFLKERLGFWHVVAIAIAAAGVAVLTAAYGHFPWISVSIAVAFGLYGLIKKASGIDSRISLPAESMLLTPVAAAFLIISLLRGGTFYFTASPLVAVLLVLSGVVTALPLMWFAKAAENIPLSWVGFTQYLTPTAFLALATLAYREPFSAAQLVSFACIWTALTLFTLSETGLMERITPPSFRMGERERRR